VNIRTGSEADGARMSVPRDVFIATGVLNVLGSVRVGGGGRSSPAAVTSVANARRQATFPSIFPDEKLTGESSNERGLI
jgi:hypothetical protein